MGKQSKTKAKRGEDAGFSVPAFDIYDPRFTHGEVVLVTGVTSKSLHNWIQREVLLIPESQVRSGRRYFSALDVIYIASIVELTKLVGVPIGDAVEIAQSVVHRAGELYGEAEAISPNNPVDIIVYMHPQNGTWMHFDRDKSRRDELEPQITHIVVPADKICNRAIKALNELSEGEPGTKSLGDILKEELEK